MAGGLNIGDVFMRVLADMTGFGADVEKEAAKTGDKAGKTLGSRLKIGMAAGLGAVGAGAGVLFGAAAKGAAELTDAMARFQAETGATADELESARKSVLDLSKTNIQGFDEIAATQAKLRTDLGLTQAEAEKSTEAFLRYGVATGQNAAEGVAAFDDILDNWGLTAADAVGLMDKLVLSHQKYGGTIADNQATLAALAPSLRAANFEIDDGISLLNLFGAKGLDATVASAAFSKALTKVKSPEELQALITDISNTQDPFLRASKAADLFGARAGAKLANALGGVDLKTFAVSMDEAAGATDKAAAAIENTPWNKLQLALRGIVAPAIEAGQAFGPLLLALSQLGGGKVLTAITGSLGGLAGALSTKLGPRLKDGLVRALGRVIIPSSAVAGIGEQLGEGVAESMGRSSRLGGAFDKVGGLLGGRFGTAFKLAALLGIVAIADELLPQAEKIGASLHDAIFPKDESPLGDLGRALHDFGAATQDLPWPLGPKGAPDWATIGHRAEQGAATVGEAVTAGLHASTSDIAGKVADDLAAGRGTVAAGANRMLAGVDAARGTAVAKGQTLGAGVSSGVAQGLYDVAIQKQSVVQNAFKLLLSASQDTMHKVDEINYLVGVLTSKALARGLTDTRESVRAAAEETRRLAEDRLRELNFNAGNIGKQTTQSLAKGMHDKDPQVAAQARRTNGIITGIIRGAKTRPAGQVAGNNIANGVRDASGAVGRAAQHLASVVYSSFIHSVQFAAAHHSNPKPVERRAGGGETKARTPYIVGEEGTELFVPKTAGTIIPHDQVARYSMPRPVVTESATTQVNLKTYGLPMRAETPAEVAAQLRRVAGMGLVSPRRRLGWSGG